MKPMARALWLLSAGAVVGLVALATLGPPVVVASTQGASEGATDALEPAAGPDEPGRPGGLATAPRGPRRPSAEATPPAASQRARAAMAAALAGPPGPHIVFVAVDAIRQGELGAGLVACFRTMAAPDATMSRDKLGLDLAEAIDRVGVSGDLAAMTGRFAGARWDTVTGKPARPYGQNGKLYGDDQGETFAVWGDEVVLVGPNVAAVQGAIDRIEGRAPQGPAPQVSGGGEVRGSTTADEALEPFLAHSEARSEVRDALRAADLRADFHLTVVDGGLQVSVRVHAPPPATGPASDPVGPGAPVGAAEPPLDAEEIIDATGNVIEAGLKTLREGKTDGDTFVPEWMTEAIRRTRLSRDGAALELQIDVPATDMRALLSTCGRAAPGAPETLGED